MKDVDPIQITELTEQIIQQWNDWAEPVLRLMENWWFPFVYMAFIILWTGGWAWLS